MKTIYQIAVITSFLLIAWSVQSQNPDRFPRLHERIVQAKLHEIKQSLKLDDPTFERFRPVYIRYEHDLANIDLRKLGRLMRVNADSLSSEDADRFIVNQLDAAKTLILTREKYYHEFKKVIEPQQIIKLYQTEAEIRRKVIQEIKQRRAQQRLSR